MNVFLTADTHLGHTNIIKYCNRPFETVGEMDAAIFDNWAKTVKKDDCVYHLGDVIYGRSYERCETYLAMLAKLPGKKFLIPGNHDGKILYKLKSVFTVLDPLYRLSCSVGRETKQFELCHYPLRTWQGVFRGVQHFFGHVHGRITADQLSCDVGVDSWGFAPVNVQVVLSFMKNCSKFTIPDALDEGEGA